MPSRRCSPSPQCLSPEDETLVPDACNTLMWGLAGRSPRLPTGCFALTPPPSFENAANAVMLCITAPAAPH